MPTFRKKPVVIEAVKWSEIVGPSKSYDPIPKWAIDACNNGTLFYRGEKAWCKTLEGEHRISKGDWIIKGVKGELYPCKPDIFKMTYDPVTK